MIIPIVTGDGRRIDHDTDEADRLRLAALCEDVPAELWGLFADEAAASHHVRTQTAPRRAAVTQSQSTLDG